MNDQLHLVFGNEHHDFEWTPGIIIANDQQSISQLRQRRCHFDHRARRGKHLSNAIAPAFVLPSRLSELDLHPHIMSDTMRVGMPQV